MFEKLPLLDYVQNKFRNVDLSNVAMITCQHTLQSIYINFQYLFELGLKPENVFMVSKVYSYNKTVSDALAEQGIHMHKSSSEFNSHEGYDTQFARKTKACVEDALREIKELDVNKILVVDDGGYLLAAINDLETPYETVGMEWTTAGYRKVLSSKLALPVLNMARSNSKLRIESPMIAWGVIKKIEEQYRHYFGSNKKALIVGAGPIGIATRNVLKEKGKEVDVIDATTFLPKSFATYDLIVGCTGHNTVPEERLLNEQNEIVLVSASSSDREFPSLLIRKNASLTSDSHKEFTYNGFILPNAGFPINFDGDVQFLPLEWIQLTMALAFSSICIIASTPLRKGLNLFPIDLDNEITDTYLKITENELK